MTTRQVVPTRVRRWTVISLILFLLVGVCTAALPSDVVAQPRNRDAPTASAPSVDDFSLVYIEPPPESTASPAGTGSASNSVTLSGAVSGTLTSIQVQCHSADTAQNRPYEVVIDGSVGATNAYELVLDFQAAQVPTYVGPGTYTNKVQADLGSTTTASNWTNYDLNNPTSVPQGTVTVGTDGRSGTFDLPFVYFANATGPAHATGAWQATSCT